MVLEANLLFLYNCLFSIGLGVLIGIEREIRFKKEGGVRIAGVRTFPLITLLGFLGSWLSSSLGFDFLMYISFLSVALMVLVSYSYFVFKKKAFGITTEIGIIIAFIIGVLVDMNNYFGAVLLTVIVVVILMFKTSLEGFAISIKKNELLSAVKFLIISLIIFPLLPNQFIDPFNSINPYRIWLLVVIVSAVSYLSFIALKLLKEKGLILVSFFGGLVNSTATSASLASNYEESGKDISAFKSSILIADSGMLLRNGIIAFIAFSSITFISSFIIPLLAMLVLSLVFVVYLYYIKINSKIKKLDFKLKSPFAVLPALKFAFFLSIISFLSALIQNYFGSAGVLIVAVIGSFISTGAVIASISSLALTGSVPLLLAGKTVIISCAISMAQNMIVCRIMGSSKLFKALAVPTILLIITGSVLLFF